MLDFNPILTDTQNIIRKHFAPCKGIWIPESGKVLLVESGILGFGIQNPSSRLECNTWNPESLKWNRESKHVLDSLTLGETLLARFVE